MPARTAPKGYLGIDHETIGKRIVALCTSDARPRLRPIDPQAWYPVGVLLDCWTSWNGRSGTLGSYARGARSFECPTRP